MCRSLEWRVHDVCINVRKRRQKRPKGARKRIEGQGIIGPEILPSTLEGCPIVSCMSWISQFETDLTLCHPTFLAQDPSPRKIMSFGTLVMSCFSLIKKKNEERGVQKVV
jgi:hypothetical protein